MGVLLAAACAVRAQTVADGPRYALTVIGGAGSVAYDVNVHGDVVGELAVGGTTHAFLYAGGALSDLGTGGATASTARHVNDGGSVVGTLSTGSGVDGNVSSTGFLYAGGRLQTMAGSMSANGINNGGTVTGVYGVTGSDGFAYPHAYSYANGVYTDVGTLIDDAGSYGYAINDAGVVAGSAERSGGPERASSVIRYRGGVLSDLGGFAGPYAYGYSINEAGDIVGVGTIAPIAGELYPNRGLLFSGGALHELGSLTPDGASAAYDINDLGRIVGSADVVGGQHGFIVLDGKMIDLNTLLDGAPGWTIQDARAINDVEQIAATACRGATCYAVRLDPLSPVPEPAGWAMSIAGVGIGLAARRRRRSA